MNQIDRFRVQVQLIADEAGLSYEALLELYALEFAARRESWSEALREWVNEKVRRRVS